MRVLVTGAGGALGGHLVNRLVADGHRVLAVDVKPIDQWWQHTWEASNHPCVDLSELGNCRWAVGNMDRVYNLAANMGGIGFITEREAECGFTTLITAHMLKAAADAGVERFVQTSSACIYPIHIQERPDAAALRESDAWPAAPDHLYGAEKLYGEQLAMAVSKDMGMQTRIARLHNVYGTHGEWRGGREKAPAALARKVAEAKLTGSGVLDIWGDGQQTRSFCHVSDFVEGIIRIGDSDYDQPLNLGSSELVTIDALADIVESVAGVALERRYDTSKPQGVRGRCSDNTLIREVLGWEPTTSLADGIAKLYPWVESQVEVNREGQHPGAVTTGAGCGR